MSARAWVNFTPTSNDYAAWSKLAAAAVKLAGSLGKSAGDVQYIYNGGWQDAPPPDPFGTTKD